MTPKLLILNQLYNPIDVEFTFTLAEKFENTDWDLNNNGYLDVEGSGLLATLTDEMNALNAAYLQSIGEPKAKTVYLFLLPNAPQNRDGISIAGDMPRDKRFGYLFPTSSAEILGSTIAHELGHGLFNLKHIFDRDYGINQNTTDNLMDYTYTGGTKLIFYQWNQIHDPGHVWGLFEKDGDAMLAWAGGITWLGDVLWGLASDPQEKYIENMKKLLDHVHEKYADYFEKSKANDIAITKTEYTDWSVRKFSHQNKVCKSIYEKITNSESPSFNLHPNGIFVEKYKLENKEYSVAVYSFANAITLQNSNIKLIGYKIWQITNL
ncbi:hypothetical protein FACS1894201_09160 [Bacteroidia bacterium]|nr:hypothetical protein FACS1894201_09160 [Bacteroidia bacterium]